MSDAWISAETEAKEAHFRGILQMHVAICKGIAGKQRCDPYLYVDLYAGPGWLEYEGRRFAGSPLIAQDVITRAGLDYQSIHFEQDAEVAARLAEALWIPTSLLDTPGPDTMPIFVERCQDGFTRWLNTSGHQPQRYGLVYADPISDEIPHALLNEAARLMPKVDLLSYVAATQYKRRRGADLRRNGHSSRPLLSDHVNAVQKRFALIRTPRAGNQYTFILWTNWDRMPVWTQAGFHRLDSETGRGILDYLDLTKPELHEAMNTPLPFRFEPAVPDVPGVPATSTVSSGAGAGLQKGARYV